MQTFVVPLNKGKNEIYFSIPDNILQKRLRKLDIVEIKRQKLSKFNHIYFNLTKLNPNKKINNLNQIHFFGLI